MTIPVPRDVLARVKKLALLPEEAKHSRWALSVTRLRVLESLCQEHEVAGRFVTHLAHKTLERISRGEGQPVSVDDEGQRLHHRLVADALAEMDAWLVDRTEERRVRLRDLLSEIRERQNEYKSQKGGAVRIILDSDLLFFEYALSTLLASLDSIPHWAYQTARHYAERYTPSEGTGLTIRSAPLLEDIADFWLTEFDTNLPALTAAPKAKVKHPDRKSKKGEASQATEKTFTHRQGQFLAFIHLYRKLHRRAPAEHEFSRYFRVTPPAVHGMIVKLKELGLITREPGVARSARVSLPEEQIPPLEEVEGPPW